MGDATTAPVGSKMRSLRARAERRTDSFQEPLYVDLRIQSYQYLFVVYGEVNKKNNEASVRIPEGD